MENLDFEESCNCKFNMCKFYDYDNDCCSKEICFKLKKSKNIIYNIGQWLHKHFEDFTKPFVLTLGFIGIICAIIGHYGTMGFNWKWFVFFELPLYLFCSWALYKAYKLYKISKKL